MRTKQDYKKKGQAAITDLFIAIFIFLILMAVIVVAWNLYVSRLNNNLSYNEAVVKASQITDVMVKTAGQPLGWNSTSVETIGLATSDRKLSTAKVKNFTNMTTEEIKEKLGIKFYNFNFKIKKLNNTIMEEVGEKNFTKTEDVVSLERIILYNEEKAILEFALQKK